MPGLLEALLSQSRLPEEIIVVDDGSTDSSVEIVESYARKHSIIRLIRHPQNMGTVAACKTALEAVKTDYTYSIGADDLPLPGFHEQSMAVLEEFPHAGVSFSLPTFMNEQDQITISENNWSKKPCYYSPDQLATVLEGTHIYGAGAIVKRQALYGAGGDIPEHRWHADWFYLLTIGFRTGGCFLPEGYVAIRVSHDSYHAAGQKDRKLQVGVLQAMMRTLLKPEYQDVLGRFIRSRSFSVYGDECIDAITSAPELWQPSMMMLIQDTFFAWMTKAHPALIAQAASANQNLQSLSLRVAQLEIESANRSLAEGRAQQAVNTLVPLVQAHPNMVEVYSPLCRALRVTGQHDVADSIAKAAGSLFPNLNPTVFLG